MSESHTERAFLTEHLHRWTRGTGLMNATNIVAHELEGHGVRTFSAKEMAFNTLGLMHPLLFSITQVEPIWADLNGGMDRLPDLADITGRIRKNLLKKSELRRAIAMDNAVNFQTIDSVEAERLLQSVDVIPFILACLFSPVRSCLLILSSSFLPVRSRLFVLTVVGNENDESTLVVRSATRLAQRHVN